MPQEGRKLALLLELRSHHEYLLRVSLVVIVYGVAQPLVGVGMPRLRRERVEHCLGEVLARPLVGKLSLPRARRGRYPRLRLVPAEAEAVDVARPVSLTAIARLAVGVGDVLGVVLVAHALAPAAATAEAPSDGGGGSVARRERRIHDLCARPHCRGVQGRLVRDHGGLGGLPRRLGRRRVGRRSQAVVKPVLELDHAALLLVAEEVLLTLPNGLFAVVDALAAGGVHGWMRRSEGSVTLERGGEKSQPLASDGANRRRERKKGTHRTKGCPSSPT